MIFFKKDRPAKSKSVLVVGGVPEPIGGVTSFIYRLLAIGKADKLADIYPSQKKKLPLTFKGTYEFLNGVFHFYIKIIFSPNFLKDITEIHFNFSTTKSLLILGFLPVKKKRCFHLTLHHGKLKFLYPIWFYRFSLRNVDVIYSLSNEQYEFYKRLGRSIEKKVKPSSSYVPLEPPTGVEDSLDSVERFLTGKRLLICSGFCTKPYNHHWVLRLINDVALDSELLVFLYGNVDDEYLKKLESYVNDTKRAKLIFNASQDSFNFYLAKSDIYIRPTEIDSFGIAVADAVNFGVKVLATDVCRRYPGTYLFTASNYDSFAEAYKLLTSNAAELKVERGPSQAFEYIFPNESYK
jgi:hypothetical protein